MTSPVSLHEALVRNGRVTEINSRSDLPMLPHFAALGWVDAVGASVDGRPVQVGDTWDGVAFGTYVVDTAAITAEQAQTARARRDALLSGSDWSQQSDATRHDVPLTDAERAEWAAYRYALKILPKQAGFPGDIDWPVPPGAGA